MAFCPSCHAEYRAGIASCAPCGVPLVDALPEAGPERGDQLRAAVTSRSGEAVVLSRVSYTDACQMVETLHSQGVDALVHGDPASCDKGGTCSHFYVVVLKDDTDAALGVLKAEWRSLIDQADLKALGTGEVDLDAEGAHACPACAATFEGAPQECPECGLFLGAEA